MSNRSFEDPTCGNPHELGKLVPCLAIIKLDSLIMSEHLSVDALPSFMAITGTDSATATQYLELTNWNLEESVNLFMESGAEDGLSTTTQHNTAASPDSGPNLNDKVRAPDPSKRQRLVGADLDFAPPPRRNQNRFRDFAAESVAAAITSDGVVPSESQDLSSQSSRNLNALFKSPMEIMFDGTYAEARQEAKSASKWLLVNIQDEIVFASHMLNRDTWSDDVVQNLVASGFVFWQSFWATELGKKFCVLYRIDRECLPFIGIIHPRSGEVLAQWNGFLEPVVLIEKISDFSCQNTLGSFTTEKDTIDLMEEESQEAFSESVDDDLAAAIAASLEEKACSVQEGDEEMKEDQSVEVLPCEPSASESNVTRIQIRCPDGTKIIRRFYKSESISILRTFVRENVHEARTRPFNLRTAYPPVAIDCNSSALLGDQNLENAVMHVHWI
uniref:Uncharacterized protein AlNc14C184G8293 n=1 Tax=Albugo laibachii Nc14 TaxID=890382 RepID=F0WPE9_9STRA|nr:conserved hypothetical protein [Albugo laibachii Nc14]|eukprot:CCA23196.1 conserved hypothetical protein [Albugo laibachii Nc14]